MANLTINGKSINIDVEPDTPLLWAIRENVGLTGTKYGCGIAQCGACTVHVDGVAMRSCGVTVSEAAGKQITTIEGLESDGDLHPLQEMFIEHDGFQCGFCTSGQIMSAAAMIEEAKAGWPSAATVDVTEPFTIADLSKAEIRERMSGNLCRCSCYPNIVAAIAEVVGRR